MAETVIVRPPDAFRVGGGGNPSVAWARWKLKFNIFLQATGASTKPDIIKVGLLLNHIGDEGLKIFENSPTYRNGPTQKMPTIPFRQSRETTTQPASHASMTIFSTAAILN